MRAVDILKRKRDGGELDAAEVAFLVDGFVAGHIPAYQISAFLMAVFWRGMSEAETVALTERMLGSGTVLDFSDVPGEKIDKHSTGGVGDKTSLILAPLAASAGVRVPMISGRGLGHSGGTLDKLESIPGFDVRLDEKRFKDVVARVGAALVGQTNRIAPADRVLYALRDVTATVESLPLITASILSKKLAEGISGLVLDVKTGSGAFMKTAEEAEALARLLLDTASRMGKRAVALVTDMSQPLGHFVGNALEVEESIAVLKGEGPEDLTRLSVRLAAHMLLLAGLAASEADAEARVLEELDSGRGLEKLVEIVTAQGGDPRVVDGGVLPRASSTRDVPSPRGGFVAGIDTERVGKAAMLLGAGREKLEDAIDPAAGLIVHAKLGSELEQGEPLVTLHFDDTARLEEAEREILAAYSLAESPPPSLPDPRPKGARARKDPLMERFIGIAGLAVILGTAYALSLNRRAIRPRTILWGLALQFAFALFVMKTPVGIAIFGWLSRIVTEVMDQATAGGAFVFGDELARNNAMGFIFVVRAVPIIIFLSSLFSVLYYLGILQKIVLAMAKVMSKTMDTSGAESLSCAANVFMGQTEAPLVIAPYIDRMTYSELATLMIGGMATISGAVLGAYISMGVEAQFLLSASIMNAPAALLLAKMLVPETGEPLTRGEVRLKVERREVNVIDAAARGAGTGMTLSINIIAMLIAFLALIALVNWPLQSFGLSLEQIFSWVFAPLAYVMGVPWAEAGEVGFLFGQKLILNEFVAYVSLGDLIKSGAISPRSELIATYALCGFANLGSIGIQIGGIGALAPSRKEDLARLGVRAVIGGSLATFMTATIAGLLN